MAKNSRTKIKCIWYEKLNKQRNDGSPKGVDAIVSALYINP